MKTIVGTVPGAWAPQGEHRCREMSLQGAGGKDPLPVAGEKQVLVDS